MLEIAESGATIIACAGPAQVLDRIAERADAFCARVAPGELLLIGGPHAAPDLLGYATQHVADGLALDMTDAWAICTVTGVDAQRIWDRLSENPLPAARPAFVQGAVASIPAKAVVCGTCIHFLTPSPLRHHLPARILQACGDLDPRTVAKRPLCVELIAP